MYLIISEKPSVSNAIGDVLGATQKKDGYLMGDDCLISWCLGHLADYVFPDSYDPKFANWRFEDLPIIPKQWKLAVTKGKEAQYKTLCHLLNRPELEYVVNACDAGREGELIFRRIYTMSGSKLPVKRLWISSMEDDAIRKGFRELKDARAYDDLAKASICRAKADWLVGINATRAYTTQYFKKLTVGRVQSPTLAMLVERNDQIQKFQKEKYFNVTLNLKNFSVTKEKIFEEQEADALMETCRGNSVVVKEITTFQKEIAAPKLYDLTSLQRDANRLYGMTAQQTMDAAQKLYEKKLITYPRTDSRFLTDEMKGEALDEIEIVEAYYGFKNPFGAEFPVKADRILNSKKVSDHHAIIPTAELKNATSGSMGQNENKILYLVSRRLLAATLPPYVYEETKILAECAGNMFQAKGKKVLDEGWKCVEFLGNYEAPEKKVNEGLDAVPAVKEGQHFPVQECNKKMLYTSPPKQYSEDTLLGAMEAAGNADFDKNTERKGIGTPATRAGIIEKLITCGYAMRRGKQLLPTQDGTMLIQVLPEYLKSPSMTAEWENELLEMEHGKVPVQQFMDEITLLTQKIIEECRRLPEEEKERFLNRRKIGICPACGRAVYEGKKSYYCSNPDCRFVLWKENRYLVSMRKVIDPALAENLLENGRARVRDLYSARKGTTFEADLCMEYQDERVQFRLEFPPRKKQFYKKGEK